MLHFVCRWWGGCHALWAEVASNRWPSWRSPSNESLSHCWIFLHTFRFIFCFICYILFPVSLIPVILNYVLTFFQSQSLRNAKKDKRDAQKRISKDTETSRSISSAHSRSKVTESLIQVNPLRMITLNSSSFWTAGLLLTPTRAHLTPSDLKVILVLESSLRQSKVSYINMPCLKPIYYTVFKTSWQTGQWINKMKTHFIFWRPKFTDKIHIHSPIRS